MKLPDFQELIGLAAWPKVTKGKDSEKLFALAGVTTVDQPIRQVVAHWAGMTIETDPILPDNAIRIEYPEGRSELFVLGEDGKLYRVDLEAVKAFAMQPLPPMKFEDREGKLHYSVRWRF